MLGISKKLASFATPISRSSRCIHNRIPAIEKSDVLYHDKERDLFVVRLSPKLIPIVKPSVKQFLQLETTGVTFNVKFGEQHVWPFVYNVARYPYSYFIMDKEGDIVNLGLNEVAYRDPSKDPRPRAVMELEKDDSFMPIGSALDYSEARMFELYPQHDKFLIGEVAWTKPELRRQKLATMLVEHVYKPIIHEATAEGFVGVMSMVTSIANRHGLKKMGWKEVETLPDHAYDAEGFERKKLPEGNAVLYYYDLIKAKKMYK